MSIVLFKDNASTTLAAGIASTDTSITVATGTGVKFPAPAAGQVAFATLEDSGGNVEVVTITSKTTDTFVVTRGTDGTTPLAFASGTVFEMRVTMGMLQAFLQKNGGDTLSGTTTVTGVINLGSGGSVQGGEYAGGAVRSQAGDTSNQIRVPIGSAATAAGSPILTTANFLANLPSGVGAVISGMILLWSGLSSNIPSGYLMCNGASGTPDLRDQFVIGAGGALPTTGGSSSTTTGATSLPGLTVGSTSLTVAQLPAHNHTIKGGTDTLNGAGPGFAITGFPGGAHFPGPHGEDDNGHTETTGPSGAMTGDPHTHSISGTTSHTHSYSLPPYRALFYIMKT
jgi:hypothetical protein